MKRLWYEEMFDHIDNKRMDEFLAFVTDDITLTFGNQPSATGKDQVRAALTAFWQTIEGLKHHFVNVFESSGHFIFEETVSYTRMDRHTVTVPCVTVIKFDGERARDWRIYTDLTPVFSPG